MSFLNFTAKHVYLALTGEISYLDQLSLYPVYHKKKYTQTRSLVGQRSIYMYVTIADSVAFIMISLHPDNVIGPGAPIANGISSSSPKNSKSSNKSRALSLDMML